MDLLMDVMTGPRRAKKKKTKRVLERHIEDPAIKHAKKRGWITRKMNGLGFRSWPDRLFLPPPSKVGSETRRCNSRFWVEFKKPGEKATPDQVRIHEDLRARGEDVYVCDTLEKFIKVYDYHSAFTNT